MNNNYSESIFDSIKHLDENGNEFWYARELQKVLEYSQWRRFENVIQKAIASCENSNMNVSEHFANVGKMVSIGSSTSRNIDDYQLSRYACYLIVQNGDPRKQVIALGQTYFATKTRQQELMEQYDELSENSKRLAIRSELTKHNKSLAAAAQQAGVNTPRDYAVFQNRGYQGLYGGLGVKEIHARRSSYAIQEHQTNRAFTKILIINGVTMKLPGYYSSGEFAAKAHITKKTIRYYDEHHILKPSFVNENGARFYTDEDFARLQQILFLKYLGFSLDDIREMTMRNGDRSFLSESLHMQLGLMEERMEQMQLMKQALQEASEAVDHGDQVDWSHMLQVVNINEMEQKLKNQYLNSSNISARINLHKEYATNQQGWFPWLYEQCHIRPGDTILELGCGDASLWLENMEQIPSDVQIVLSDLSDGMLRDVKRSIGIDDRRFHFDVMDAHQIHMPDQSVNLLIANHVLFYCEDLQQVFREVKRVLKPDGVFICSTYSEQHMKEISELVQEFDDRIVLSADRLYERFGKGNGRNLLKKDFSDVSWVQYEDHLNVTDADALIAYVLSCHGNQNRYIVDRYRDFRAFVKKKTEKGFYITKDAGAFIVKL